MVLSTIDHLVRWVLVLSFLLPPSTVPLFSTTPSPRSQTNLTPTIRLKTLQPSYDPAGPITVELWIDNAQNLGAFELALEYNDNLVQFTSFILAASFGQTTNCNPASTHCVIPLPSKTETNRTTLAAYSYGNSPAVNGSTHLATIQLVGKGEAGQTPLTIREPRLVDTAGKTTIPTVTDTILTLQEPQEGYQLYLPLIVSGPSSDADPTIQTQPQTPAHFTSALCPDFVGDGQIDTVDLEAIANRWGEKETDTTWNPIYDLDNDGHITVSDIMLVAILWGETCTSLPPDPSTVAPPLSAGSASDICTAATFLFAGDEPIQIDVIQDKLRLDTCQIAVIRGQVLTADQQPLPGVTISILDRPEYGYTLSRSDGMFDLVVNAGKQLTVNYKLDGRIPVQRQLTTPWQDYTALPDVVLLSYDEQVTTINLTQPTMQVAQSSIINDDSGARQATLLFPANTRATMHFAGNSRAAAPLTTMNVRATEYTVGENGPAAMPGDLPAQSGYTYAIEFSVDEAVAADAATVEFDQPVIFYVENFLEFPVGGDVPVGYYDRERGEWIPYDDGRVITIVDIANGLATVDSDGNGLADNDLNLSADERTQLAQLYEEGDSLWRVLIPHFSPWDCNWPFGPPADAVPPALPQPGDPTYEGGRPLDEPTCAGGSIIECENQILGEMVDVIGTPFMLHYRSNRTPGFRAANALRIPLSGAELPASLAAIHLRVSVAGQTYEALFPPTPNQSTVYTWDGRDGYGRDLQGSQTAHIEVGYEYEMFYQEPAQFAQSFGRLSGLPLTANRGREAIILWQSWQDRVGGWDARGQNLGGWTLDIHHAYDPLGGVLYLGNGQRRSADDLSTVISTIAGTGVNCPNLDQDCGVGGPATEAQFVSPWDVAADAEGNVFVADLSGRRVWQILPSGIITTVVGPLREDCNSTVDCGDGGPAAEARTTPNTVTVGPDGSLYIVENALHTVRQITPDGLIQTIAGRADSGTCSYSGDGGLATEARLCNPIAVEVAPDGNIYIADSGNGVIRQIDTQGIISTVVGDRNNNCNFPLTGVPAAEAALCNPIDIAIGPDGTLYIADSSKRVHQVGTDGIFTTVAGNGLFGWSNDGVQAISAAFRNLSAIEIGPDGALYIAEGSDHRIRRVGSDGILNTVVGISEGVGSGTFGGDGRPAAAGRLFNPQGITFAPDSRLFIVDSGNLRIRQVAPTMPRFSAGELVLPSADGSMLYVFTPSGRHLRTIHTFTGATLYEFGYDNQQRLISITDGDGNVLTVSYSSDDTSVAITGYYGQVTTLTKDSTGWLSNVVNPAAESYVLTHTAEGLLTAITNPRNQTTIFNYDLNGRLLEDTGPVGNSQTLTRTQVISGYQVSLNSALNRTTRYTVETTANGTQQRQTIYPDNTEMRRTIFEDGRETMSDASGMAISWEYGPDPRFGMQSPLVSNSLITTPAGLANRERFTRTITLADTSDLLSLETLTEIVNWNGATYTAVYDAASQQWHWETPDGRLSTMTIDDSGRPLVEQAASFLPVAYSYDNRGRLSKVTQGTGNEERTVTLTYNNLGYLNTLTNALSETTTFTYDDAGRLLTQTFDNGEVIAFGYDAAGNMTALTPPDRPAHTFTYDAANRLTSYTAPEVGESSSTTSYSYNIDHQLTEVIYPDGETQTMGYDAVGRLATMTVSQGSYNYGYDNLTGQLSSVTAPDGGTLSYGYDGQLLTSVNWTGAISGAIDYSYNNNFLLSGWQIAGETAISYSYDGDQLLTQAGLMSYDRAADSGYITSSTLANITDSFRYNAFGEHNSYAAGFQTTDLYSYTLEHDLLGRIVTKTETVESITTVYGYTYDVTGQLTAVTRNGTPFDAFAYDGNGNRVLAGGETAVVDDQDRLLQRGAITYNYDANGDLVSQTDAGQMTLYNYDSLSNLFEVTLPDSTVISYLIDGQNRRIGKRVNGTLVQGFLYQDQLNPVAELDVNGDVVALFVYGSQGHVPDYMVRGGRSYRFITDHLGSVRLVVDAQDGTIVQRLDYDVWGVVTQDSNPGFQPFGFAGGLYDADTGLVRFGARDYDPASGRWTTKDPIGFAGGDANTYVYTFSDPVNYVDPNGMISFRIIRTAGNMQKRYKLKPGSSESKVVEPVSGINPLGSNPPPPDQEALIEALRFKAEGSASVGATATVGLGGLTVFGFAEAFARLADPTPWGDVSRFFDAYHKAENDEEAAALFHAQTNAMTRSSICDVINILKKQGRWRGEAIPPHCDCE